MIHALIIMPLVFYVFFKVIKYFYRIDINNYKYRHGISCPRCGSKMQLIEMHIFNKSKDMCNICGFEDYSYKLRKEFKK